MATVQTGVEHPTFETVWAALQEVAASQKETDRLIKELREERKETDKLMKENAERQKETDAQMKRTDERMGFLSNRFGEMAEHLVKPGIYKRFNELGYHFTDAAEGNFTIRDENGKIKAEIDLLLENDDTVMVVEVKATPKVKHVEEHIKRIEILRDHRRKRNERQNVIDNRKVEGAIAGAIFGVEEKKATVEAGLYVIEQSGDTMKIEVPDDFVPRKW